MDNIPIHNDSRGLTALVLISFGVELSFTNSATRAHLQWRALGIHNHIMAHSSPILRQVLRCRHAPAGSLVLQTYEDIS